MLNFPNTNEWVLAKLYVSNFNPVSDDKMSQEEQESWKSSKLQRRERFPSLIWLLFVFLD